MTRWSNIQRVATHAGRQCRYFATESEAMRYRARSHISKIDASNAVAVSPLLTDSFKRGHDYLRISLTEKCNLRCTYCMPAEGVELSPKEHMLTTEEILRLARLFISHGITKIRLTGGEPTIRTDLQDIIHRLSENPTLSSLGMTTNGIALHRKLPGLVQAGLTNINLSLDTLDEYKFELMTRRRGHSAVLKALETALAFLPPSNERPERGKHLSSVKLNVVVMRGVNDNEIPAFVDLSRSRRIGIRFIEYMPFDDNAWSTKKLVPSKELLSIVQASQPDLRALPGARSDTAKAYAAPDWHGNIGFISSMTDHFCGGCSRLRLAADGRFKVCLFGPPKLSLREMLRSGSTDEQLMDVIGQAVKGKKFAHDGKSDPSAIAASKNLPMVMIGGLSAYRNSLQIPTNLLPMPRSGSRPSSQRLFHSSARIHQKKLTHFDGTSGRPAMVSVSEKADTLRRATAAGKVYLGKVAYGLVDAHSGKVNKKGDVMTVAQLAGIMGAKNTSLLIPLCHPLSLTHIDVSLRLLEADYSIQVQAVVETRGKTGVEMEALTAVSVSCLTVWDMVKAAGQQEMCISDIKVIQKSGGKSGDWSI